jgi:hypothetical protein
MDNQYVRLKAEFDELKSERSTWNTMYQILGEYVSQIKQNFETQPTQGDFLVNEIYDSTGPFAAHAAASVLLGMLWPGTAKQALEILPPDDIEDPSSELTEFYETMTNRLVRAMDDPRANLALSLDEYMLDQLIFGTSGVGCDKGDESKLLYKPYGVKEMFIDEGRNGRVNAVYIFYEWTVARLYDEYEEDNLSEKVKEKFKAGHLREKIKVLQVIKPRREKKAVKGKLAMPYMSIHMEYDTCHVIKEDGFNELPIMVGRFRKLNYERYGRSPAMNALPDIREANALRESVIVATEKALDMPKGILDDGMLGGGVIDTSAHAINVFNASASTGSTPPIFDIGSPPDITAALSRLEELKMSITQHFYIDRLLDMNNQTQMTFGEAQIRDARTNSSMTALFSRQIAEVVNPLIERSVNILWRSGEFGVIQGSDEEATALADGREPEYFPDEVVERLKKGEEIYQIVYKTKAANASRAEEYIGIIDILQLAIQAMNVDPSIANRLNLHEGLKETAKIRAIPPGIIRQDDEVEAIEAAQNQQAQMSQMLEAGQMAGGIAKDMAQAEAATRQ